MTEPFAPPHGAEQATLGGGCFWCMEGPFEQLPGVVSVTSGYSGGSVKHPTYEAVSSGSTAEAVTGTLTAVLEAFTSTFGGERPIGPRVDVNASHLRNVPLPARHLRNVPLPASHQGEIDL